MAQIYFFLVTAILLYALYLYFKRKRFFASLMGLIVVFMVLFGFVPYFLKDTKQIQVEKTEVKPNGLNLIYTNKNGTFKIEDNIWYLQYRSSDLFGKLLEGNKYEIAYYGLRLPYMSAYPNIYSVKLLEDNRANKKRYYKESAERLEESTEKLDVIIQQNRKILTLNKKILEKLNMPSTSQLDEQTTK